MRKSISVFTLCVGVLSFFASCSSANDGTPAILFPSDGASFPEGEYIVFSASEPGEWNSDVDGQLGNGESLSVKLSAGEHRIEFRGAFGHSSISVRIMPPTHERERQDTILPTYLGHDAFLAAGGYAPVYISSSNDANALVVSNRSLSRTERIGDWKNQSHPIRDIAFEVPKGIVEKSSSRGEAALRRTLLPYIVAASVGDIRSFRVADPEKGTGSPGFTVEAELCRIEKDYAIWLERGSVSSPEALEEFLGIVNAIALPRVMAIFGPPPDPDGDGRIDILLTKKLNEGGIATGFFNPCDFFTPNDDSGSESYNPTSNGRDMLYAGMPEPAGGDQGYSAYSIAATLAHEYQHAGRFSQKTYVRVLAGEDDPPVEDPAFDEAVSHFTESLVGLGLSGGNLLFAQKYLNQPSRYSLFGIDSDGASDSAGKRGCGALFISYLFGLAGGGAWDAENPLVFRGNKALKFLQDPRNASASGWECVSAFFGKPIASLWRDFCLDMNKQTHFPMPGAMAVDAFTGEPSGLDPFMGHYEYGAWSINLAGPAREPDTGTILLTAWSARYAEPFTCGGKGIIRYQSLNHEAEGFISIGLLHL